MLVPWVYERRDCSNLWTRNPFCTFIKLLKWRYKRQLLERDPWGIIIWNRYKCFFAFAQAQKTYCTTCYFQQWPWKLTRVTRFRYTFILPRDIRLAWLKTVSLLNSDTRLLVLVRKAAGQVLVMILSYCVNLHFFSIVLPWGHYVGWAGTPYLVI